MSISIPLEYITEEVSHLIREKCIIRPPKTLYTGEQPQIPFYKIDNDQNVVKIPLGIWKDLYEEYPIQNDFPRTNVKCKKLLYTIETDPKGCRDQDVVFEEARLALSRDHVVFLALNTGFGKTTLGNYFCGHLKLKTVVLCHISEVNRQWITEFSVHSTAKVQYVKNGVLDPTADVYVMGVRAALSIPDKDLKNIGLVIIDEAHICTITAFSETLFKFSPLYVIALSASPWRSDGMQKIFGMYFGSQKNYIVRKEVKDYVVYKVETDFVPEIEYVVNAFTGPRLNWNKFINSIAYNTERQIMISKLAEDHPDDRILILSNRVKECESIYRILVERGERVDILVGTKKRGETEARIIVAGMKKAGVGFDDPTLTMLILATDCKDVVQYDGRLRTENCKVFDIVDRSSISKRHWEIRESWYESKGATIKVLKASQIKLV